MARELAKGTRLYISRAASLSTFVRCAGVVGIGGPQRGRANVDATELDTSPDVLPSGETEEMYFYKLNQPGTKEIQAVPIDLNKDDAQMDILDEMYDKDEVGGFEIRLRSGAIYGGLGYIETIGADFQSDQMVKTPITIMPIGKWTYTPAA
jgi:hypothetical protein